MDGDDLELFERSLRHATEANTGGALDAALDELGWQEAMGVDRRAAISTLFRLQGEANVTSSALSQVVAHVLTGEHSPAAELVLPPIGRWDPPGTVDGHDLHVRGLATATLAGRDVAMVVTSQASNDIAITLPVSSLELRQVEGIDPSLGLLEVTADARHLDTGPEIVCGDWGAAIAVGRLAIAHELVGASRKMLELAREHAIERVQFSRPIGSFQAIRHRLAETLVAIETAEAVLDAAWLDGSPDTAAMAKAVAGRQARTTARHCQQVLAGIGFTTEHPFHLYVRRTLVLDGLLGTTTSLTRALGTHLISHRQLPPLLPL
jgi:alkylation response protein AidB-like acyl-CoA dehydrogenase